MAKSEPHGYEALVCDYLSRLLGTPVGADHPYCAEALALLEQVLAHHRPLFAEANKPADASRLLQQLRGGNLAFHSYSNCDLLEDVLLALLMEHGENEAYRYFEGRYGHDVRAWARYYAPRDPTFAGGVLGSLYAPRTKSAARITKYDGTGPLRGWLKEVIRNLARSSSGRVSTVQLLDDGTGCDCAKRTIAGHGPVGPVDKEIERRDCLDLLAPAFRGCFDVLGPEDRLVLKQAVVDDVDQVLIAKELGLHDYKITRIKKKAIRKVERRFHKLAKAIPNASSERVATCLELLRERFSDVELDLESVLDVEKTRNECP